MIAQFIKAAVRTAAGGAYGISGRLAHDLAGRVVILMYHRVIPHSEVATTFVQPGMYVTPETFERHLRFLAGHFRLLSFPDLLAQWHQLRWDEGRPSCVLTFDDGWLDNHRYAYPLLRAYRAPATIFLPTDMIGTVDWFWPDRLGYLLQRKRSLRGGGAAVDIDGAIERAKALPDRARERLLQNLAKTLGVAFPAERRLVDWDEVREMSRHGITFGSHTCTHANLTRLAGAALQRELRRPLEVLEQQRVAHVSVLSYPNGNHTGRVVAAARAAGYRAAVTTNPGVESGQPGDVFRLKRISVHEDVSRSIPLLAFHIARQARQCLGDAA